MHQNLASLHRRLPTFRPVAPVFVAVAACLTLACGIEGSGNIEQRSQPLNSYSAISIENGFSATVAYGENFGVTVWADDNLIDDVHITQDKGTVHVSVDRHQLRNATLEAEFTLPRLFAVKASDGSSFSAENFPLADEVHLVSLDGSNVEVSAPALQTLVALDCQAEDGSTINFNGKARDATIEQRDGSYVELKGDGDRLSASIKDGSELAAKEFSVEDILIRLVDGSHASVSADDSVSAYLADGASLNVSGSAQVDAEKHDGSSVSRD